jgi:hypothetical protein
LLVPDSVVIAGPGYFGWRLYADHHHDADWNVYVHRVSFFLFVFKYISSPFVCFVRMALIGFGELFFSLL